MRTKGVAALVVLTCACFESAYSQDIITMGTGGVTGLNYFFETGGAITRVVNRDKDEHGVRLFLESTSGSVYNLNALAVGELDVGIVKSDWQSHAVNATHENFQQPISELRSLFSLHGEPLTLMARADAGISTISDLMGKRVNVGATGSGQRVLMDALIGALEWEPDGFADVSELSYSDQVDALCEGEIDAMVFAVSHPSRFVTNATAACETVFVPIEDAAVDELVASNPYYAALTVPADAYSSIDEDVPTFGVRATFVATTNLSEDVAYELVKAVFENFDEFARQHPALAFLSKEEMALTALTAPLHDGARRYFEEAGLL